ncbi:MAG: DUF1905 domain-containing protein [Bacteroidetes bacterium]|nr:MAG: DUF1905 domain-containing protein [Bacteroidota bacterium]REK06471.1 MAG: DUF1905 domain-containing protein [Bacteroidota bacterium]REK33237.1 MAG: DUF1905 domain-containing protein [Bacteroidota bacterium]REK47074.1 MAG: DUF1905 domain-containing protein [Bacteroidota bacterium]
MKFNTHIGRLLHMNKMTYLFIPSRQVKKLGGKLPIRLWCSVNGSEAFQCGLVALGKGDAYITITKKRMKEYGVTEGDEVQIELKPDESKYGMEVPEELEELLKQDHEGRRRFEMLSPGKQRYIINYVSTVKNSVLRMNRALLLIGNLKLSREGKENFRQMLGLE